MKLPRDLSSNKLVKALARLGYIKEEVMTEIVILIRR